MKQQKETKMESKKPKMENPKVRIRSIGKLEKTTNSQFVIDYSDLETGMTNWNVNEKLVISSVSQWTKEKRLA